LSRTLQLYQLQILDTDIDKVKQELAEIARQLGESQALKEARQFAEAAEIRVRKGRTSMQDLDLEVKSLTTKIDTEEKKLYGGKALNAKEAANLQGEVASLKRRQSDREELLLEAMLETEEAEEALEQARTQLGVVEADWRAGQDQLKQREDTLNQILAELIKRRVVAIAPIAKDDLSEYESLRAKKAGRAVVTVSNSVCQGCGMIASNSQIQRARTGTELTYCTVCGRIFYIP
jgi:predicted  nucleic acid-binding Zn-ribbon protein